jgi:glycosyltransferase involved in cell wall biosynthesis
VVVTDVPGNREVVGDERHAMLVPVADAAALAQAIGMLLANPERARQQGLRGRERVQERFDFRRALDKTLALYDEVIAERRGARETTLA